MNLPTEHGSHPELELTQPLVGEDKTILTPSALAFLAELAERFTPELTELLAARRQRSPKASLGCATLPELLVVASVFCSTNARVGAWRHHLSDACPFGICQNRMAPRSPVGHIVCPLRRMGGFRIRPERCDLLSQSASLI